MLTLNNTSKKVYKRPLIMAGIVFMVVGLLVVLAISSTKNTNSAPTWSGSTYIAGSMAQVNSLIRPSDGAFFFIGENGGTALNGDGQGGGIFIRTNAATFSNTSGGNFNSAFRVVTLAGERGHDAIFDRNSNLLVTWHNDLSGGRNNQIYFQKYDSNGNVVIPAKAIGGTSCGGGSFQCTSPSIATSLFATAPNEIYVAFKVWVGGPFKHMVVYSNDGGTTWSQPTDIDAALDTGVGPDQPVKIMQAPNGNVYAVIYRRLGGPNVGVDTIYFNRKLLGQAWGSLQRLTNGSPWANQFALSIDASSQPYILFNGNGCGTEAYYTMRSTDFGASFTNPAVVPNSCGLGTVRTKVVAGITVGDGSVWFSIQWSNGGLAGQRYVWSADGNSWQWGNIYNDNGSTGSSMSWWNNRLLVGAKTSDGGGIVYSTAVGGGVATTPPSAPNTLTATYQSGAFQLSWKDTSTTETNFYIERKVGLADWAQIAAPASTTTAGTGTTILYTDNSALVADTVYQYRVRAGIGGSYFSDYSNTVVNTTPPAAPTLVTAIAQNSTSVALTWSDVNTETSYDILNNGNSIVTGIGANTTGYLITTGITQNTVYNFTIRANNSSGSTTSTPAKNITTPPAEPTNLTITSISNSQASLSFQDNGTGESGFHVERRDGANGAFVQLAVDASSCLTGPPCTQTYNDTASLTPGQIYYYRVRAISSANANVVSGYSNIAARVESDGKVVVVTKTTDHGDTGDTNSLSWAIDQANQAVGDKTTIIFQLTSGSTVTFDGTVDQLPALTANVKIAGGCDPTNGPTIKIVASTSGNTVFDGLKLQAGAIAYGLQISGFNGKQLITGTGGDNATSCVKTSKAPLN